ncbi:MAG: glyoxalase superfamily protein [Actinobacteria bacterium]|nr:glyoxalase superfamily protein [Actinomycetota bacterium]MDA8119555.1 glyoxalase superfamily protein [Gammaproteobacteria bacterium]
MAATAAPTAQPASPQNLQTTATALWTFVHLKVPRFTSEAALKVVEDLQPRPDEDPKALAKRLRKALSDAGVSLKHTAALDAASRILGHSSWHACNREPNAPKLKLTVVVKAPEEQFSSWHELASRLAEWLEAWHQVKHTKVFEVRFSSDFILVCVPEPKKDSLAGETDMVPALAINPIGDAKAWLTEAPAALEMVRRRLEETERAVLDGVATLLVCGRHEPDVLAKLPAIPQPVTPDDACNSELVLLREDNELMPGDRFEIARGDEMTCWSQLELAVKKEAKGQPLEVSLEDGAWRVGRGRYVWQMSTLHPEDYVPGQVHTMLTEAETERLLRRYRLAKRILGGMVKHHHVTKQLKYLSGPEDTYRIDLHRVLHALNDAGHDWDSFCVKTGIEQDKVPEVKVGFVMTLAEHLKLKDPNKLFASPLRAQLAKAVDDTLIRSLMFRVDFVRYRTPSDLFPEQVQGVRDAIEDFSASIRIQKMQQLGQLTDPNDPLPYLCYAGDGEELRLKLADLGLEMYVGVMPHLISTEGVVEKLPGMWSYAFGHAIYLDIDRMEEGA